ncbi:hypothetical protein LCGC14_0430720 [marine sediment metagenome]|uniref:Tail sheath protein C-terminal domain-containing protein n=1 Tax=marine sediment metagenome TaxID=412755 RepID=A0A0F9SUE2_9ZZZZ
MATLPQPDVLVEQVFEAPTPTLIPPSLPVVVIGVNNQIEFRQTAGAYDGTSAAFTYPNLISGAAVDTATVEAHLFTSLGVFKLLPADLTITTSDVTVGANAQVDREVVATRSSGKTAAPTVTAPPHPTDGVTSGLTLTSAGSTFVVDGILPGMTLHIIEGTDAGSFIVDSVTSDTVLVVKATPWTGFTAFTGDTGHTFFIPVDLAVFEDLTIDFFKAGVAPQQDLTILSGGDLSRPAMKVEKILSATQIAINAIIVKGTDTGETTVSTNTFDDSGEDFTANGTKIGDLLVIEEGADISVRTITAIPLATQLTVDGSAFSATATTLDYRIVATLAAASNVQYKIDETNFELTGSVLLSYTALRTDNIGKLVQLQTLTDINGKLGAAVPENPLAFAASMANLNTDTTLFATAVAADTVADFTLASEFLENEDVYALNILTQDPTVAQIFSAHVTQQSDIDSKHERIVFINRALFVQSTKTDEDPADTGALITNNTSPTLDEFDDSTADFVTDGIIQGDEIEFTHTTAGVDVSETTRVFSVTDLDTLVLVDGLTAGFITAWNTAAGLGDAAYTIKSATLDKFEQADNIADFSESFANRRVYNIWPDLVEITFTDETKETTFQTAAEIADPALLGGGDITAVLPGYFLGSMIAGMVPGNDPEQPFTNFNIIGAIGLRNSNRYFSDTQLDTVATGGTYIVVQDAVDGPVSSRHQLSTNVLTIETRELSITKVVDFTAKFLRGALRPYIGKFNITDIYLEQLRTVVDGVLKDLIAQGVLIDGTIVSLEQSVDQPDTVLIEIDLQVPFPANFIRITLLV